MVARRGRHRPSPSQPRAAPQPIRRKRNKCQPDVHSHKKNEAWEVARTVVAPPLSVVKCLWDGCSFGGLVVRVCVPVSGVFFSVGVSCVRVTC